MLTIKMLNVSTEKANTTEHLNGLWYALDKQT